MKRFLTVCVLAVTVANCTDKKRFPETALDYCVAQTERTLTELPPDDYTVNPRNIAPDGREWNLRKVTKDEWTSGFWPGILWYAYEYTGDAYILEKARKYTEALEFLSQIPAYDHDLGFLVFCSYGNGYRLTGDPAYREVIVNTAQRLAELYNPKVGTLLSWPREVNAFGGHNTIMDNMINLEMLFWAADQSGDRRLYDMAVTHADTTLKYGFRPDGTSYHVSVFDPETGRFIRGCTHQGYADETMWARGQAWAIYGYTMCYRFTGDVRYRDFACKTADAYLERLPDDMIPYWDFDDPAIPHSSRDASAAAIVSSALLELSGYLDDVKREKYFSASESMLRELDSHYRGGPNTSSFLLHSTGHRPAGSEIDYAIIYADYYYIEALTRFNRLAIGEPAIQ